MLILLFSLTATAATERVASVSSLGTDVPDLSVSADGRWVAAVESSSGQLRVLDTRSWETEDFDLCSGAGIGGVATWEVDDQLRFYVGCADGSVNWVDGQTGELVKNEVGVVLTDQPILGVAATEAGVYALADSTEEGGHPQFWRFDPETGLADTDSAWPATLGYSGYEDMAAHGTLLVVSQGGDNVSKVDLSSGSAVQRQSTVGAADATDVIIDSAGNSVLLAGGSMGVLQFKTASNDLGLVLDSGDGLEDVGAIVLDDTEERLIVADSGRRELVAYSFSTSSGTPGDQELSAIDWPDGSAASYVSEMVALDGYLVAGNDAGELWIITERPWVEADLPSPSSAVSDETVTVSFSSDTAGDWELLLGATSDDDGTLLASGTIEADATETASFVIDDAFAEGDNDLRVTVDGDGGVGHDTVQVAVDNPPGQVAFSDANIGFGDSLLSVSFTGLSVEDIDHYVVYISTSPFEAADWPEGGPDFDGTDEIDAPIQVTAGDPGATVSTTISPLTNGSLYYLAVRATDQGGLEGPMSDVVTATPQQTFGVADLAGETGGYCGVTGSRAPGAGLLFLAVGLIGLRRRRSLMAGAALAIGLASPLVARADEPLDPSMQAKLDRHGSFQLRYGPIWLSDPNIEAVLGDTGHQVLFMEAGPSVGDILDFTLGFGFYQELGYLVSEDGSSSSEHDMLTAFPVTANAALRLDFFEEQLLVPVGSVGGDYWLWRENWYVNPDVGGADRTSGAKYGWHWGAGVQLRLDNLEPARASRLQNRTGIDDSYLSFEYRAQQVGDWQDGLSFDGSAFTVGLKLDF